MQLTADQKELCRRLREELDVTDAETIAAADLIEILAAHSAGAQEPVAWRYLTPTGWHATTKIDKALGASAHHEMQPLYTRPQPMTDAARDTQDAKRWRHIYKGRFVICRVHKDGTLENLGGGYVGKYAIDAEIERRDRAKGE